MSYIKNAISIKIFHTFLRNTLHPEGKFSTQKIKLQQIREGINYIIYKQVRLFINYKYFNLIVPMYQQQKLNKSTFHFVPPLWSIDEIKKENLLLTKIIWLSYI